MDVVDWDRRERNCKENYMRSSPGLSALWPVRSFYILSNSAFDHM